MSDAPPYQVSRVNRTVHLIRGGVGLSKENETLLQDAARAVDLVEWTVMAQIAASKKWVPWLNANLGATDGKAFPIGIYMGDPVLAASLVAGDVTGAAILIGSSVEVDAGQLVFDGGSTGGGTLNTLDSLITAVTGWALRGEECLNLHGIWPRSGFWASKNP